MATRPTPVVAKDFIHVYESDDSRPVEVKCDDEETYVVKCLWSDAAVRPKEVKWRDSRSDEEQGRRMFNDQVCGRLGALMGAAVPTVGLVDITQELIDANKVGMGHLKPSVAHASRRIPDVIGKLRGFEHADKGENRQRYLGLAIFFGLIHVGDMQFIRGKHPPHTVYSCDHGHCFPNGPMWTQASLTGHAQAAVADTNILTALKPKPGELDGPRQRLAAVTREQIAAAIAAAPDSWKVPLDDRVALAKFVFRRQGELTPTH